MSGPKRLTAAERLDWLRLIRSENVGPRTFWALLDRYGSAARALAALPDLARRGGAHRQIRIARPDEAEREMGALNRLRAEFVACGEPGYPAALAATDAPPPLLAVRGEAAILTRPMVALVGSRNASAAGQTFAARLTRGIAEAGFAIVSGLARGIDASAHRASLDTGTVAVLPGGHDHIYPRDHIGLADSILQHGALVTEMPTGWEARGRDFPRRNRIVAGLALATVVVEAARRSGSLITARLANEQGRDVFAVPGSPLDPRAEGTNDLLRQGATLCTRAEDVVDALQPRLGNGRGSAPGFGVFEPVRDLSAALGGEAGHPARRPAQAELGLAPAIQSGPAEDLDDSSLRSGDLQARIAALLSPVPITVDELIRLVVAPIGAVQEAMLELELATRLQRHAGNRVSTADSGVERRAE